jgi:hypothetical protein
MLLVAESFFSNLKRERIKRRIYKTRDMARADVFDYKASSGVSENSRGLGSGHGVDSVPEIWIMRRPTGFWPNMCTAC